MPVNRGETCTIAPVAEFRAVAAARLAPTTPGVYLFYSDDRQLLYVGKAINLRRRVKQHFARRIDPRPTRQRVAAASTEWLCWIETPTELHALLLEDAIIKRHSPVANKQLKKWRLNRYIYIEYDHPHKIRSVGFDEPKPTQFRSRFGPYENSYIVKDILNIGARYYGIAGLLSHPSFRYDSSHTGAVDFDGFSRFLASEDDEIFETIESEISVLSRNKRYEEAASARDRLLFVKKHSERRRFTCQFVNRVLEICDSEDEANIWVIDRGADLAWRDGPVNRLDADPDGSAASTAIAQPDWILTDRAQIVRRWLSANSDRYRHTFRDPPR